MTEQRPAPVPLNPLPLSAQAFAPYGTVLAALEDGVEADTQDGLDLSRGAPRFYVMRLHDKPGRFDHITRHRSVTQCLASVGGGTWWLAVAPPDGPDDDAARPDEHRLVAFEIPGDVAVRLHRGTWHAGPFFAPSEMGFFNLELADTNVVDHHTVGLSTPFVLRPATT